MSRVARAAALYAKPRMLYGYDDPSTGVFRKFTRVSSDAVIMSPKRLAIGDHVWIGHHCILDASEGLQIAEGVQLAAWIGVFTHGSENAVRLLGRRFVHVPSERRPGYTRGTVSIGPYSYVGAQSVVLPGVTIGTGCLVSAMSLVSRDVEDYQVVRGQPARVVGDTRDIDRWFASDQSLAASYYNPEVWGQFAGTSGGAGD